MLLSLLTLFSLGITPCFTGTGHSRPAPAQPSVRDEIARVIEDIRHSKCSPCGHTVMHESFEAVERIAYEESGHIRCLIECKKPYEYGTYGTTTKLVFADCALLIDHIKRQIAEGSDSLAKKPLLEFVETLEQADLTLDTKILNFYRLFISIKNFYNRKFKAFGFCVHGLGPEGYGSAEAVRNYHAQQDTLDEASRLTLQFLSAFLYILFHELDEMGLIYSHMPLRSILHHSLSYCYPFLGPVMCPKFPEKFYTASLISDTGCSGGAGTETGRARASTASDYSSEGISDLSDEYDKTPAKSRFRLFSQFVPNYSLS
jgi:hypothetical protein